MNSKVTKLFSFIFSLGLIIFALSACEKETTAVCKTTDMSFSKDIKPVLTANGCLASGCHSSKDAFSYETYVGFKVVVTANRVLGAIKQQSGFSSMPKVGKKMSDCDISKVEAWITQGAKDN